MRDEKHLKHFLALMHDFIEGDKSRIRYFLEYMNQEDSVDPTLPLANLLNVKSPFVQFMAALLIGNVPCGILFIRTNPYSETNNLIL